MRDPFCRAPYRQLDAAMRETYAALAKARRESPLLRSGDAAFAAWGEDCLLLLRYSAEGARVFAFNRAETPITVQPALDDFRPLRAADAARFRKIPKMRVPALGWASHELRLRSRAGRE